MLNQITVQGRLTGDPILRYTNNQTVVCSFTLACERDYAPEGQKRDVDFIDVVAWKGTAEFVQKYFHKGDMAFATGRLQMRQWEDKNGNKRVSAEVVADHIYFGAGKKSDGGQKAVDVSAEDFDDMDEADLPF